MSDNSMVKELVSDDNSSTVSGVDGVDDNNGCLGGCVVNDLMTSSYNEISMSPTDMGDQTDVEANDDLSWGDSDQPEHKKMSSSLSLPQLSSSIVKWTERTKASYESTNLRPNTSHHSDTDNTPDFVSYDGHLVSYVAQDFQQILKHSSSSPSIEDHLAKHSQTIEFKLLNQLEKQSKLLSNNINSMLRHISESTHNITSLTVECTSIYETSLNNTCDVIDSNIKSMYQLMAKCEELNQSMKPIGKLSEELKEVKRLLELFEKTVDYKM